MVFTGRLRNGPEETVEAGEKGLTGLAVGGHLDSMEGFYRGSGKRFSEVRFGE